MKSRLMRSRTFALGSLACALLAGCALNDSGYKPGELGNGGFYFSCDDAAACSRYSDDASKFPKDISVSSTFAVRFKPKTENSAVTIQFDDRDAVNRGITVSTIGDFVTKGPTWLTAVKTGYTSLVARDARGFVIDYTVVRIARPDSLVVFAADEASTTPARVDKITLGLTDRRAFRAFAQKDNAELAGSLQLAWTSTDPTVVAIESAADGKATIVARRNGNATLTVKGAALEQSIPVEVAP